MDVLTAARAAFEVYKNGMLKVHSAATAMDTLDDGAGNDTLTGGWSRRFYDHGGDKRGRERMIQYEIAMTLKTFSSEFVPARGGHCVLSAALAGSGNVIKDIQWWRNMGAEADCYGKAELYGPADKEMFDYYVTVEDECGQIMTFAFTCHREAFVRIHRHYRTKIQFDWLKR